MNKLNCVPSVVDIVLYNTILVETSKSGNLSEAVVLLDEMIQNGVLLTVTHTLSFFLGSAGKAN